MNQQPPQQVWKTKAPSASWRGSVAHLSLKASYLLPGDYYQRTWALASALSQRLLRVLDAVLRESLIKPFPAHVLPKDIHLLIIYNLVIVIGLEMLWYKWMLLSVTSQPRRYVWNNRFWGMSWECHRWHVVVLSAPAPVVFPAGTRILSKWKHASTLHWVGMVSL